MKVKWRQHEMNLVTATGVILLVSYLWNMTHLSQQMIDMSYAGAFRDMHVPFNLYRNVIIPVIGSVALIYLFYLWINLYTIPRFLFPKKFDAGTSKISISFLKISLPSLAKKIY